MIRDGQFIREELPRIGAFYNPELKQREYTYEELFFQDVFLQSNAFKPNIIKKLVIDLFEKH